MAVRVGGARRVSGEFASRVRSYHQSSEILQMRIMSYLRRERSYHDISRTLQHFLYSPTQGPSAPEPARVSPLPHSPRAGAGASE